MVLGGRESEIVGKGHRPGLQRTHTHTQ